MGHWKGRITGENERQHQRASVNKTPPDKESFWEKLTRKTCINHTLFPGPSHARVKFGRATGGFPHGHSHLMNSLYL